MSGKLSQIHKSPSISQSNTLTSTIEFLKFDHIVNSAQSKTQSQSLSGLVGSNHNIISLKSDIQSLSLSLSCGLVLNNQVSVLIVVQS